MDEIIASIKQELVEKDLIGCHPSFVNILQKLKRVSENDVTILMSGETGTGKSKCAEFLHHLSERCNGPFIVCNCGALPETLFESQLFGHAKGAYTGAHKDQRGLVEEANHGTLVLDEVNSLDYKSQVKLNHFLETKSYLPVGCTKSKFADVRIVAATNVDLVEEIAQGNFRQDLYYRLAEYEIELPPLRKRIKDIQLLINYFIDKFSGLNELTNIKFSARALETLCSYSWPGNIRELENFIKRCLIDSRTHCIDHISLPGSQHNDPSFIQSEKLHDLPWKSAKRRVVEEFEKDYVQALLKYHKGVVTNCARHAGIHPSDFWRLMRKYAMSAEAYR